MHKLLMLIYVATLLSEKGMAQSLKWGTWNVGLTTNKYNLKHEDNSLTSYNGVFQIGRGFVGDWWTFSGGVDVIMGPFQEITDRNVKTDFFGTGFTLKAGYSLSRSGLRSSLGSWGLSSGISYSDIVGRSVEPGSQDENGVTADDLNMRVSSFMVTAGLFHSWFLPARIQGNTADLLMTRIEGWTVGIDFAYPIKSSYSLKYDEETEDQETGEVTQTDKTERGTLKGYVLQLYLTASLGY